MSQSEAARDDLRPASSLATQREACGSPRTLAQAAAQSDPQAAPALGLLAVGDLLWRGGLRREGVGVSQAVRLSTHLNHIKAEDPTRAAITFERGIRPLTLRRS